MSNRTCNLLTLPLTALARAKLCSVCAGELQSRLSAWQQALCCCPLDFQARLSRPDYKLKVQQRIQSGRLLICSNIFRPIPTG